MTDDTVTERELDDVVEDIYATLRSLHSKLAHALRCDERDLSLELRGASSPPAVQPRSGTASSCSLPAVHAVAWAQRHLSQNYFRDRASVS
jgi:hypothetical protein